MSPEDTCLIYINAVRRQALAVSRLTLIALNYSALTHDDLVTASHEVDAACVELDNATKDFRLLVATSQAVMERHLGVKRGDA